MAKSAYSPAKGPGKGPGNGNPRAVFTIADAKAGGIKSGYVRRARAEARRKAIAAGNAIMLEPTPSRSEIAGLAKVAMPAALERLEQIIHSSRSDSAVVQAYNALKESAYGKDAQILDVKVDYSSMTDEELRSLLAKEAGLIIEHDPGNQADCARIAPPESAE